MSTWDWINIGLTMLGVFAALSLARLIKQRYTLPSPPLWPVYLVYNGLWGVLLLLEQQGALVLPSFVGPIALVGGNAVLVNLFGLPALPRLGSARKTGPASDPNRERIVPGRKKKRQKRRR